jgi:hypothetical protein
MDKTAPAATPQNPNFILLLRPSLFAVVETAVVATVVVGAGGEDRRQSRSGCSSFFSSSSPSPLLVLHPEEEAPAAAVHGGRKKCDGAAAEPLADVRVPLAGERAAVKQPCDSALSPRSSRSTRQRGHAHRWLLFPHGGNPSRRRLADVGGGDDGEQDPDRSLPLRPFSLC